MNENEDEIQRVREAIIAAFPEFPIPDAETLIRKDDPYAERFDLDLGDGGPAQESIRQDLVGKNWRDLDRAFLKKRWSSFGYLSPTAYRYYLPSLLMAALEKFPRSRDMAYTVVTFDLTPSFWFVYWRGSDKGFRTRQAVLTPDQYRTVGAFLGLVMKRSYKYSAARALYWGWNQVETPALAAARAYFHTLSNYTHKEPKNPEIAAVYREIWTAFANTPSPHGDVCWSSQGDDSAECTLPLRNVPWQSAHPELVAYCSEALYFFTNTAFRYFIPAFMIADLISRKLRRGTPYPVRFLIPTVQWSGDSKGSFNKRERIAIIRYLEFCRQPATTQSKHVAGKINAALTDFWYPSIAGETP